MKDPETCKAIFLLHQNGMGAREIAQSLRVSRNTVKKIIQQHGQTPNAPRKDKQYIDLELLLRLYGECQGQAQRVFEKLNEEEDIAVKYSTLTRILREEGISNPPESRCDSRPDVPGGEMQHDTSPYKLKVGGKIIRVIASLLYLRYSKRRYLRFYRVFNRFKMKCFFHEALLFWGYASKLCIIDNTNLARLRGTGKRAVIVPEMAVFSRQYKFCFVCHEIGHSDRKAGEERSFRTVETNFFPGRIFKTLEDLNQQALEWATVRLEHRPQGKAKVIPAKAFEHEQNFLEKLSAHLPAPYQTHERIVDQYGYVSFDGNYYWVPGTKRFEVKVFVYAQTLKIYFKRKCLAEYPLADDGVKNTRFSPEGKPQPRYQPRNRKKPTAEQQHRLRALGPTVGAYLDLLLAAKGIQHHWFIRRLDALTRQMSVDSFERTIKRALHYKILDIEVIRRIAALYATECLDLTDFVDVDENLEQREEYREGAETDTPDLSAYDWLFEDTDPDQSRDSHEEEQNDG